MGMKDVPSFLAECTIRVGTGKEEWGAEPGVDYYILEIRNIFLSERNIVNKIRK